MLADGLIEQSTSPRASPTVTVKNPHGDWMICIDYRRPNSQTVQDSYLVPHIDKKPGAKYFSSFDLGSYYHQIKVAPQDQEKNCFCGILWTVSIPQNAFPTHECTRNVAADVKDWVLSCLTCQERKALKDKRMEKGCIVEM
ncbi:unnamed protein product [Lepidochelys kempii]